jgi:hypothetical protein
MPSWSGTPDTIPSIDERSHHQRAPLSVAWGWRECHPSSYHKNVIAQKFFSLDMGVKTFRVKPYTYYVFDSFIYKINPIPIMYYEVAKSSNENY